MKPSSSPDVTDGPETHSGGSVQPVVGPPDARWMTYLVETGEIDGYEGTCKCYACQRVRDGYERWKYEKLHNPRPAWRSNSAIERQL